MSAFHVTLQDLSFHRLTVLSTPNTHVASLIEQFREVAPSYTKNQRIILMREDGPLRRGTLGENGIREDITLIVAYGENTACIHPEPIAPYLYEWIEEVIEFDEPILKSRPKTYHADCTDLLAEHNEWTIGEEYRFFLTDAPPRVQRSFPSDRFEENGIVHYVPSVGPDFPLNITLYPQGIPSDSHETMRLDPFSSVKGTLDRIKLRVIIKPIHDDYECKYQFNVFLKGPIEIRDDLGTIIASFDEAVCMMKYDQMVRCDEFGGPVIPKAIANAENAENVVENAANAVENAAENRNQGGKRSKQSKQSTRSKRSKRKTRRTRKHI